MRSVYSLESVAFTSPSSYSFLFLWQSSAFVVCSTVDFQGIFCYSIMPSSPRCARGLTTEALFCPKKDASRRTPFSIKMLANFFFPFWFPWSLLWCKVRTRRKVDTKSGSSTSYYNAMATLSIWPSKQEARKVWQCSSYQQHCRCCVLCHNLMFQKCIKKNL